MSNFREQLKNITTKATATREGTKQSQFSEGLKRIMTRRTNIGKELEKRTVAAVPRPELTGQETEQELRFKQADFGARRLEAQGKFKEALELRNAVSEEKGISQGFFAPWWQGVGDVVAGVGQGMAYAGEKFDMDRFKNTGDKLKKFGTETSEIYRNEETERILGEYDYTDLFKPEFYHHNILRAAPFTLALLPASIATAYGGATVLGGVGTAIAGRLALGIFGKTVLKHVGQIAGGLVANTLFSRPIESAIEAGQVYSEMLEKTDGNKELAIEAGDRTFKNNMKLSGMDTLEALAVLTPAKKIPFFKTSSKLGKGIARKIVEKGALIGGKMAVTGGMEATEEILQQKFSTEAKGEKFSLSDPSTKQAGVVGFLMGGLTAGGGEAFTTFQEKVRARMPEKMKAEYEINLNENLEAGDTQQTAEIKAMDKTAESNKGATEVIVAKEIKEMAGETGKVVEPSIEEKGVSDVKEIVEKARPVKVEAPDVSVLNKIKNKEIELTKKSTAGSQQQAQLKATRMIFSAIQRKLTGKPTFKELEIARKKLTSNFVGKKIVVAGKKGKVTGTAFGKIRVDFGDGKIKSVDVSNIDIKEVTKADTLKYLKEEAIKELDGKASFLDSDFATLLKEAEKEQAKIKSTTEKVKKGFDIDVKEIVEKIPEKKTIKYSKNTFNTMESIDKFLEKNNENLTPEQIESLFELQNKIYERGNKIAEKEQVRMFNVEDRAKHEIFYKGEENENQYQSFKKLVKSINSNKLSASEDVAGLRNLLTTEKSFLLNNALYSQEITGDEMLDIFKERLTNERTEKVSEENRKRIADIEERSAEIKSTIEEVKKGFDVDVKEKPVTTEKEQVTKTKDSYEEFVEAQFKFHRIEEPNIKISFDKPQGLYVSFTNRKIPRLESKEFKGGKRYKFAIDDNAKILKVSQDIGNEFERGITGTSAGVRAVNKLADKKIINEFYDVNLKGAEKILFRDFPELKKVKELKFYDAQDAIEAYGGKLAKNKGYDIIESTTKKTDLLSKQYEEAVILNKNVIKTKSQLTDIYNKTKAVETSTKATKTAKTAKPTKTAKTAKPTKTAKTAKPTKTAKTAKTAKTTKTTKTAKTTKTTKTAKAIKTTKPAKAIKTTKPAKAIKIEKELDYTGKKKTSKLFKRLKKDMPEFIAGLQKDDPTYTATVARDDIARAATFVEEHYEQAISIVLGEIAPPSGIRLPSLLFAIAKMAREKGDLRVQKEAIKKLLIVGTKAGKEVEAFKHLPKDSPEFFVKEAIKARIEKVGRARMTIEKGKEKMSKQVDERIKSNKQKLKKEIDKRVPDITNAQKIINSLLC